MDRATLLLTHSPSQTLNQQRLETYLSSYGPSNLDLTDRLNDSFNGSLPTRIYTTSGADTPRDLAARVRIIELFTLHVLPRNEEWEYAAEFISLSEILDEERKELFLQTLEGLKEEKKNGEIRAAELQRTKDAALEQEMEDERQKAEDEANAAASVTVSRSQTNSHIRNTSEVDYGSGKESPRNITKGKASRSLDKSPNNKTSTRATLSSSGSRSSKKQVKPEARSNQAWAVATALRNLFKHIINNISANPMALVRTLLFLLGILMALGRQNVRDRVRRMTGFGWQRLKGTVGMGMKVSYI